MISYRSINLYVYNSFYRKYIYIYYRTSLHCIKPAIPRTQTPSNPRRRIASSRRERKDLFSWKRRNIARREFLSGSRDAPIAATAANGIRNSYSSCRGILPNSCLIHARGSPDQLCKTFSDVREIVGRRIPRVHPRRIRVRGGGDSRCGDSSSRRGTFPGRHGFGTGARDVLPRRFISRDCAPRRGIRRR